MHLITRYAILVYIRGKIVSVSDKNDKKLIEKHLINNLAYYFSEGYSIETAASKVDINPLTALELTSTPDWEKALKAVSPTALKTWQESQEEDSTAVHVRSMAKKDGMLFYKMMKSDMEELSSKDRIPLVEKLLRLGGFFD